MLNLPQEIAEVCAPLFLAVPWEHAMPHLLGSYPHHRETVEAILAVPVMQMNPALSAGLWLYVDNLERSHAVSQSLPDPTGAFWHGIMHRREGDFSNSRYWMHRAEAHPLLSGFEMPDPVELVRAVSEAKGTDDPALVARQRTEWATLFQWCALHNL